MRWLWGRLWRWCERILYVFWDDIVWEDGGCKCGDRHYDWGGGVTGVEVANGEEMIVGGGGADNTGNAVVSGGEDVGVGAARAG